MSVLSELGSIRKGGVRPENKDNKAAAGFLTPWGLGLIFITIGPMIASLYLSFTNYNLLQAPKWIGLANYERMLHDPRLLNSLRVTFTYVFVSVPLQLALALGLAMLLDKGIRGLSIYRSVYYLPSLLGSSVAIAILWKRIFGADGLFNQFLALRYPGPGVDLGPRYRPRHIDHVERVDLRCTHGDLPGGAPADPGDVLRGRVG